MLRGPERATPARVLPWRSEEIGPPETGREMGEIDWEMCNETFLAYSRQRIDRDSLFDGELEDCAEGRGMIFRRSSSLVRGCFQAMQVRVSFSASGF